jgi:hypothetical protein
MEIPSNRQLVPYYPDQRRISLYHADPSDSPAVLLDLDLRQNLLTRRPLFAGIMPPPDFQMPEYDSDRRLKIPKMNHVGLLVDIYA